MALVRFTAKSLWRSWRYVVEFRDHVTLAALVMSLTLGVVSLGVAFATVTESPLVPPAIVTGLLAIVWLGAFGEYDELTKRVEAFSLGEPLEIVEADIDSRGGQVFVRLRVYNNNDKAVPDCYIQVEECTVAQAREDAYKGPPRGFHFSWSTYTPTADEHRTLAPISRKSFGTLDVAWSQNQEAKKCYFLVWNPLTQKLENHFSVLSGEHRFTVEVGSKSADIETAQYRFILNFKGGLDLTILGLERLSETVAPL